MGEFFKRVEIILRKYTEKSQILLQRIYPNVMIILLMK